MKTLYDLLGALPDDDAEALRSAFRRAVKGAHPDIRPGDPDAALKFREIIRANEILGDIELRAAYDDLLEQARLEQVSASRYARAARVHRLASGVIALVGASAVTAGGYLLFVYMSVASVASANKIDLAIHAVVEMASLSWAVPQDTAGTGASPVQHENEAIRADTIASSAAMPQPNAERIPAAKVGPAPDSGASEAGFLQARGNFASRSGDPTGAIAGLDRAVHFDPKFSVAYVDRGPALYRQRKFDRAFADIGPAKQMRKTSRSRSAPAKGHPSDWAGNAPSVTRRFQAPAAVPDDPSRGDGLASASLR
ncbi:MAG TPA: J domain-containing protein [Bradyrhizobium sp.]|jgi:curved DNA-binding protein CbpA|nr:J domain-containing protein [Bradyrhizobium sp.]